MALWSVTPAQTQKVIYTCSMDPEVKVEKSGKCPKCGMTLIKKTIKNSASKPVPQKQVDKSKAKEAKIVVKDDKMEKVHKDKTAQKVIYTCEMHPEVQNDMPRNCPRCGMKLVKEKQQTATHDKEEMNGMDKDTTDSSGTGETQMKQGENNKASLPATYTCPMHPEVHSDKPGNCPKCGMKLSKEESEGAMKNMNGMENMDMGVRKWKTW